MKSYLIIGLFFLMPAFTNAQFDPTWGFIESNQVDSIKRQLNNAPNDTIKMSACRLLAFYYQEIKPDSAIYYHQQQLALAEKLNIKMWQADANQQIGFLFNRTGNLLKSYEHFVEAFKIAENPANESSNWQPWKFSNSKNLHDARLAIIAMSCNDYGNFYATIGDSIKRKSLLWKAIEIGHQINNLKVLSLGFANLSTMYIGDSALYYINLELDYARKAGFNKYRGGTYLGTAAVWFFDKNNIDSALVYTYKAVNSDVEQNNLINLVNAYWLMSSLYSQKTPNRLLQVLCRQDNGNSSYSSIAK